ncbi:hypothetical protein [Myxococcus eversor]|uniref:hypothetical protein n=1 Tax=Myxococcus eversor TaxID=2709661 RepID=UPI0013D11BEC|nr:hypothetical protein [Myxococcus eversor]
MGHPFVVTLLFVWALSSMVRSCPTATALLSERPATVETQASRAPQGVEAGKAEEAVSPPTAGVDTSVSEGGPPV